MRSQIQQIRLFAYRRQYLIARNEQLPQFQPISISSGSFVDSVTSNHSGTKLRQKQTGQHNATFVANQSLAEPPVTTFKHFVADRRLDTMPSAARSCADRYRFAAAAAVSGCAQGCFCTNRCCTQQGRSHDWRIVRPLILQQVGQWVL